jgi:hypothetical protein
MAAFAGYSFPKAHAPVMRPSHVAAGEGVIDVLAIVKAGEGHTEWLIVELDQCATDMLTAVAKSKVAGRKRLGLWEKLRLDC